MSEENKQEENKEEKVKVTLQGREFELTKLPNGGYSGKISFKIGGIKNKDVYVDKTSLGFDANGNISIISFPTKSPQKISFKIGDVENEVDATSLDFDENGNISIIFPTKSHQKISFKIGDVENEVYATFLIFYTNGNITYISFPKNSPQKISFKIGDINYQNIEVNSISIYNTTRIKDICLAQEIRNEFYYKKSKYQLSFQSKETISFNNNGELSSDCIKNSIYRAQEIERQKQQQLLNKLENKTNNLENKTNNLENTTKYLKNKQSVATLGDWFFVCSFALIGCWFVFVAFDLCFGKPICLLLLDWITHGDWTTHEGFDKIYGILFLNQESQTLIKEHETFNKYTFFYEILKRAPIIILVILGFKFLQLAFERLRLIGEVEKVKKYLKLAQGDNVDNVKNNLLSIIAIPFFAPKKVKRSPFDRLIDKFSINIPIGSEQESGGVISKDKQNTD